MRAASIVFFAYIGFEAVSTAGQEAKDPKRDMPFGIIGSLIVCTVIYMLVAAIMTLLVPYSFPGHGYYVMPLALIYILTILRHSAISLRFFVQNVVLQEEAARLAEDFRQAKEQAEKAPRSPSSIRVNSVN